MAALNRARGEVPELRPVLVRASAGRLRERLVRRGRDSAEEVSGRLRRAVQFAPVTAQGLCVIDNDGPVDEAGMALVRLLSGRAVSDPAAAGVPRREKRRLGGP